MFKKLAISTFLVLGSIFATNSIVSAQAGSGNVTTPMFNIYQNAPGYGDETDFVMVSDAAANSYSNSQSVCDGEEAWVQVYVHNGAASTNNGTNNNGTGVAVGTTLNIVIPSGVSTAHSIGAVVDATNATATNDTAVFNCSTPVELSYVPGTAKIFTSAQNVVSLPDTVVNGGTTIGHAGLDGVWPGCFEYAGYAWVKVKATAPAEPQIDLSVTKTVDQSTVEVGDSVNWTVNVANAGPDTATGVVVGDVLPSGLSVTNATATAGSVTGTNWTVGTIPAGGSETLVITTDVTAAGTITNYAGVVAANETDVDSTPTDSITDTNQDDEDSATITVTEPETPVYVCNGLEVNVIGTDDNGVRVKFTMTSNNNDGIDNIVFDFGDGSTATVTNGTMVEHYYTSTGVHSVVATTTFEDGQTAVCKSTVTVKENKTVTEVPGVVIGKQVTKVPATVTELPRTGAAVGGLFGLSAIAASARSLVTSRRTLRDTLNQ